MTQPAIRVLIVGQGLAGTLLGLELMSRGLDIDFIDDGHRTAASRVGTAVINPVTGRRYARSWNIDELLSLAKDTYQRIEAVLQNKYLTSQSISQVLADARVEELWLLRAGDAEFQPYLDKEIAELDVPGIFPLKYAIIHNTLQLAVTRLINDARQYFALGGHIREEAFDHSQLRVSEHEIQYYDRTYSHVVFCEGYRIADNPLFEGIEIYPMKGEYLICKIPGLNLTRHIKSSVSLIPTHEKDLYWCGSTYDRYNNNLNPSDEARKNLLGALSRLVKLPVEVVHHGTGIRATTRDRRPYIGQLPDHPPVLLITGLGTKGASLAPYCAFHIAEHIVSGHPVPSEVDILRHYY